MPDDVLEEATAEIKPFLPALLAASEELQDLPDFVLVEMQNSRERVRIEKRGESVLFDLESEHESIHLSIPVETIHSVLLTLGSRLQRSACEHYLRPKFLPDNYSLKSILSRDRTPCLCRPKVQERVVMQGWGLLDSSGTRGDRV